MTMPATPLFHSNGVPTNALYALLRLTDIGDADNPRAVRDAMQRAWRKHGLQAAQITEEHGHLREQAIPHFQTLNMLGVPTLERNQYDWMILLGATYVAMHKRLATAVRAWNNGGKRWEKTAYLVSERPRFAQLPQGTQEADAVITAPVKGGLEFSPHWVSPSVEELPRTEVEMMHTILRQVGHHRPWSRSNEFVLTTVNDRNGKVGGTAETMNTFVSHWNPQGESLLIVSSQPHMLRQQMTAARILGNRFEHYDVTGYDVPASEINVTKMLDELAKIIFDFVGPD